MTEQSDDIDNRPQFFVSLTTETLAGVAGSWPRPVGAPPSVDALLSQARRLFVGATTCYDNLVQAELVALQAAENALRQIVGPQVPPKATLGRLVHAEATKHILTPRQLEWFREFALPWRNKLSHPKDAFAVSPGMAELVLHGAHRLVSELFSATPQQGPTPVEDSPPEDTRS